MNQSVTAPAVPAAVFDLDGTLFAGHTWQGVSRYLRRHRRNGFFLYAFLASHIPLGILYGMRLIGGGKMRLTWARHMSWMLRGISTRDGARAFAWVADEYFMPLLRQDVAALLRKHEERGERVILLSGTFQPLLETIGDRLGVETAIGTQLEQRDGRYTGRAVEPVCQGEGKAARLRAYLGGSGSDVALEASSAYADSIFDLPVLEMVGRPVAVYPGEKLAALAERRGWPVHGESATS